VVASHENSEPGGTRDVGVPGCHGARHILAGEQRPVVQVVAGGEHTRAAKRVIIIYQITKNTK